MELQAYFCLHLLGLYVYICHHVCLFLLLFICMCVYYSCLYVYMYACWHVHMQVCEWLQLCVRGGRTSQAHLKLSHNASLLGSWLRKSTLSTFRGTLCIYMVPGSKLGSLSLHAEHFINWGLIFVSSKSSETVHNRNNTRPRHFSLGVC